MLANLRDPRSGWGRPEQPSDPEIPPGFPLLLARLWHGLILSMRTTGGAVAEVIWADHPGAEGLGRSSVVARVAVLLCCTAAVSPNPAVARDPARTLTADPCDTTMGAVR
jgi:hypothetical protein